VTPLAGSEAIVQVNYRPILVIEGGPHQDRPTVDRNLTSAGVRIADGIITIDKEK
jgi:hypothetical protein